MQIRLLQKNDRIDYLNLINVFTLNARNISINEFEKWYDNAMTPSSLIYVLLNDQKKLIGTGKIIIEYKFNNNLTRMGHIEDVVIDEKYRGMGYGQKIINHLINIGKNHACYKIVLSCNDNNIKFYQKSGFKIKANSMVQYLDHN